MTGDIVYHAGDLIGYTRSGRPIYLPGGGARDGAIQVDDGDDDDPGGAPDDDDDDGPAGSAEYQQLLAENQRLKEGNRRNNLELAKRRRVEKWMKDHGIDDLDQWLADQGIDRETGQPLRGTGNASPGATEPPAALPAAPNTPPAPAANGGPPEPSAAGLPQAEIDRLVQLEMAKRGAQAEEQAEKLRNSLRDQAIEAALIKAQFVGTVPTAMRVIDLSKVEVDGDGKVTGTAEAVQALREEIPEWFRRRPAQNGATPPRGGGSVDGGDKNPPKAKPPKWEDQLVSRWQRGQ